MSPPADKTDAALLATLAVSPVYANDLDDNNDFPTLTRVEFVYGCMNRRGEETYDTLFGCSCVVDHLRSQFTYDEYSEAETFPQLRSTAGEKGGVFRDPEQADRLRDRLEAALEAGEAKCFIKRVSPAQ